MTVHGSAGTNQPNPTISTAKTWVPTMAQKMGADGNGGLRKTDPEILFVGRLAAEKGVDTLIRALPGVRATETIVYLDLIKQRYDRGTR